MFYIYFRWAGLYDGRYHSSELKDLVLRDDRYDHVRKNACDADVIIIDEVSMLSKKIFEQLELVCRTAMGNHQLFGGTQIISCGDFRQLRPVKNDLYNDPGLYCFQSDIWTSVFPHRCHLVDVMRQDEQELITAIDETARGAVSDETHNLLKSLDRPLPTDVQPLHLCAHNADAQWYNSEKLGDPEKVYHANVSGTHKYLKRIIAPNYLAIKIGCPVILLINLSSTLVNGLHGIVKSYDDNSIGVHFPDIKETHTLKRHKFTVYSPHNRCNVAEKEQFPLTLGYAMTIHKAQGMTLDYVEVDCSGIFEPGQVSVAIGRARSIKGLRVIGFKKSFCKQHLTSVVTFSGIPSMDYSQDLSCCRTGEEDSEETEEKHVDEESDDSDFDASDIKDIDDILKSPSQSTSQETQSYLPDFIDPLQISSSKMTQNPVTDRQKETNRLIEKLKESEAPLRNWCGCQYAKIDQLVHKHLPANTATDKSESKVWTALYTDYHLYVQSDPYKSSVKDFLQELSLYVSDTSMHLMTFLAFQILQQKIQKMSSEVILSEQYTSTEKQTGTSPELSTAGRGKIRYVAAMCVAKAKYHYQNIVDSNLFNPAATMKVKAAKRKVAMLSKLLMNEEDLKSCTKEPESLLETDRLQNIRRSLAYISDECFDFFMKIHELVDSVLKLSCLAKQVGDMAEHV